MNDFVPAVSALANALVKGRSIGELLRLQVTLQILLSIVSAEVAALRLDAQ